MKLNAKILFESLKKYMDIEMIGVGNIECLLKFPRFYTSDITMGKNGLYIAAFKKIPNDISNGNVFIVYGDVKEEEFNVYNKSAVIVVRDIISPYEIFNEVQNIFDKYAEWEESIDQALKENDNINEMILKSEFLFSHDICVLDKEYEYLAESHSFVKNTENVVDDNNRASVNILFQDLKHESKIPYYTKRGDFVINIWNKESLFGMIFLIKNDEAFSDTEKFLIEYLSNKIGDLIESQSVISGIYYNDFKNLIKCIFSRQSVIKEELYHQVKMHGGSEGDLYICYKVKASYTKQKIQAEYVCSYFENNIKGSVSFWHDSVLVLLVNMNINSKSENEINNKVEELLNSMNLKAGVSFPFYDLTDAYTYFRQACCAFELGYRKNHNKTVYFFEDLLLNYMLRYGIGEFSVEYLTDKGVKGLLKHDDVSQVSYIETLRAFYKKGMNMTATADELIIHRTSLHLRMEKIREIVGKDLREGDYALYLQILIRSMELDN